MFPARWKSCFKTRQDWKRLQCVSKDCRCEDVDKDESELALDMLQKFDLAKNSWNQPEPPKAVSGSTQKWCLLHDIAAYGYGHWTYVQGSHKSMGPVHCQFEKTFSRSSERMKLLINDLNPRICWMHLVCSIPAFWLHMIAALRLWLHLQVMQSVPWA